jgi:hypothetical protein
VLCAEICSLCIVGFTKYHWGDQIKKDEISGEYYNIHGRNDKCTQFWSEILKGSNHFDDLGIGGKLY